jgi:hypothetical protein
MPDKDENKILLRDWYLARLRKSAHEELTARTSTPAALINLDKGLIEMLAGDQQSLGKPGLHTVAMKFDAQWKTAICVLLVVSALAHIFLIWLVR